MDKAIIFGVFDFVSFHVCSKLLEKGNEVIGIHVDEQTEELFLEEKRLEVGRNANFIEYSLLKWSEQEIKETAKTTVILSLYDLFMLYKESILQKETVKKVIRNGIAQCESTAIILPMQMLTNMHDSKDLLNLQMFIEQTTRMTERVQYFYLPTIYGPWQPDTFLFQQSILTKKNRHGKFKKSRETVLDAIYIDDAIESMIDIIETEKSGRYLLESGRKEQWETCAAFLQIDLEWQKSKETLQLDRNITKIIMKNGTSISDSLTKQIEHFQRLFLD